LGNEPEKPSPYSIEAYQRAHFRKDLEGKVITTKTGHKEDIVIYPNTACLKD